MSIFSIRIACVLTALGVLSLFSPSANATSLPIGPPNDDFANAKALYGTEGTVSGTNVSATYQDWEPDYADVRGGASVWYKWTAPSDSSMVFDTYGSNFDTLLAVYTWPNRPGPLFDIASNDDGGQGPRTSQVRFDAQAGQTYYISIDGWHGDRGYIALEWTSGGSVVSQPPASASSSADLTYQSVLNMLGQSQDGPAFRAFANANECGRTTIASGFLTYYYWQCFSKGMEMQPNSGGRIDTIRLFGQPDGDYEVYPGELPNGITWQDTRAMVEQNMGPPDRTSTGTGVFYSTYLACSCQIVYQTTDMSARMDHVTVFLGAH